MDTCKGHRTGQYHIATLTRVGIPLKKANNIPMSCFLFWTTNILRLHNTKAFLDAPTSSRDESRSLPLRLQEFWSSFEPVPTAQQRGGSTNVKGGGVRERPLPVREARKRQFVGLTRGHSLIMRIKAFEEEKASPLFLSLRPPVRPSVHQNDFCLLSPLKSLKECLSFICQRLFSVLWWWWIGMWFQHHNKVLHDYIRLVLSCGLL